jgi:site-specific DNA-methyltransferase (adenine-specific)
VRVLRNGGLLFVQGLPEYLPELGVFLDSQLNFKYWIAIESEELETNGLPSVHGAVMLFSKGNGRFNIKRTRFPHQYCQACGKTLKDWGGKSHLMHPDGYVIADVWQDLPQADNYSQISSSVMETILRMLDFEPHTSHNSTLIYQEELQKLNRDIKGIVGPKEGLCGEEDFVGETTVQYRLPGILKPENGHHQPTSPLGNQLVDLIHVGDALELLKQYPANSVDLVFADPPYNLDKAYHTYDDDRANQEYIQWCNRWLEEYVRILKPTGSLYVLNLPRWAMHHAAFLNQHLTFQNWIVWNALSEPRGKLMPAHYGLLFYTKQPQSFTFNYEAVKELDARTYCLRASCIRQRKTNGVNDKMQLTDIWWDIHRIKHKRDRDAHPCQLPDALMERIIRLSTNEGDVVLDAFGGAGTTPIVAAKLKRHYVAMELDETYGKITRQKLAEIEQKGFVERRTISQATRKHTKKELQLELRQLASQLGRLPEPEDVNQMSQYDLTVFLDTFATWGKALKAAKIEVV